MSNDIEKKFSCLVVFNFSNKIDAFKMAKSLSTENKLIFEVVKKIYINNKPYYEIV